jgi:hypothetical protein
LKRPLVDQDKFVEKEWQICEKLMETIAEKIADIQAALRADLSDLHDESELEGKASAKHMLQMLTDLSDLHAKAVATDDSKFESRGLTRRMLQMLRDAQLLEICLDEWTSVIELDLSATEEDFKEQVKNGDVYRLFVFNLLQAQLAKKQKALMKFAEWNALLADANEKQKPSRSGDYFSILCLHDIVESQSDDDDRKEGVSDLSGQEEGTWTPADMSGDDDPRTPAGSPPAPSHDPLCHDDNRKEGVSDLSAQEEGTWTPADMSGDDDPRTPAGSSPAPSHYDLYRKRKRRARADSAEDCGPPA